MTLLRRRGIILSEGGDHIGIAIQSALKEILEQRNLSLRQVSRDIDHRLESIRQLANNEMERYPKELLEKLCNYLDLPLSEILYSVKKDEPVK